jgi:hypothetical protein
VSEAEAEACWVGLEDACLTLALAQPWEIICLPVCLSACLPVCLSACLSVRLPVLECLCLRVSRGFSDGDAIRPRGE